ncbi:MAG: DUF4465 domain-containing protein [Bacteroidota bacterium]
MKYSLLLALSLILSSGLLAQTTVDFEEFTFDDSGYNNIMPGGFTSGNLLLPNDTMDFSGFIAWDGWAISSVVDTETPGFLNQFAVISGSGFDGITNYAVSYKFEAGNPIQLLGDAAGAPVAGFYVNNGTYPYLSMQDGDNVAKKFGGESGNDEDFFLLTIQGFLNGEQKAEAVEFYLADYRFSDNSMDYIIDEWTYVDLLPLGNVDSLSFILTSSDNGDFGMNTPAYFCIDNFTTTDMMVSTQDRRLDWRVEVMPNPAQHQIQVNWPVTTAGQYAIYNLQGQRLMTGMLTNGSNHLDISRLNAGTYLLKYTNDEAWNVSRFVKL